MKRIINWLFLVALIATAQAGFAQEQTALVNGTVAAKIDKSETKEKAEESGDANAKPAPAPQTTSECKLCRWFELTNATISFRYRTITDSGDIRTFSQNQHREVFAGRFKFDKAGKYSINAQASSGYYFNWAYADTGWGGGYNEAIEKGASTISPFMVKDFLPFYVKYTVDGIIRTRYAGQPQAVIDQVRTALTAQLTVSLRAPLTQAFTDYLANNPLGLKSKGWNLFVRQLYFSAKPVKGLELQYGSIGINKGMNTEMTSYDDDGYVTGGRVSVKRPDKLWFDEISATVAYLGDIDTPNFFRRTHRVHQSNYHQFLVMKKFGDRAQVSGDYTFQDGSDTFREAAKVNVKESKVLDSVRFEAYQRTSTSTLDTFPGLSHTYKPAKGFAVTGEKALGRLSVGGGYVTVDNDYTVYSPGGYYLSQTLNGDRVGLGKHVYGMVSYRISPEVTLTSFFAKGVKAEAGQYLFSKDHVDFAVNFDLLKAMRKHLGWFK